MYTACYFSLFLLKFVLLEFSLFEIFLKSQLDSPDIEIYMKEKLMLKFISKYKKSVVVSVVKILTSLLFVK
jgi:hypothetical protein